MKKTILILLLPLLIGACAHDRNHPGYAYQPDMVEPEPAEPYKANEVLKGGKVMQQPVEGTVPREMMPYSMADKKEAGKKLENPLKMKNHLLQRGKGQYEIYCAICHGPEGKGNGHLVKEKLYTVDPMDLTSDYVQQQPDGAIYHTITKGSSVMGAHGGLISPDDRWKIILYIKNGLKAE